MVFYGDISSKADDLLNDDYNFSTEVKLKSKTANGVTFSTSISQDKSVLGKLAAKFKHGSLSLDKFEVNTGGKVKVEGSTSDFIDGMDLTAKMAVEDGLKNEGKQKAKATFEHKSDMFNTKAELDLIDTPTLTAAPLFTYENFQLGGSFKCDTGVAESGVKDFSLGAAVVGDDYVVALKGENALDSVNLSFFHEMNADVSIAGSFEYGVSKDSKSLTVGGSYQLDSDTSFKGKIESNGHLSMLYAQRLQPKVKLTLSSEIDGLHTAGDNHKFGLSLALGD